MTRSPIKGLSPLFALVLLAGCFGGGSEGTGAGIALDTPANDDPTGGASQLEGLASCVPQRSGQTLLCGSVTADDGRTPVAGVEVTLENDTISSASSTELSSRGIANKSQCLTDSQGEYACVLPSDINGIQIFNLVPAGTIDFEPGRFQVDVQAGQATIAQPQILRTRDPVSILDDSSTVRFVTSSCDSLPIQSVNPSIVPDAPATLMVGIVGQARFEGRSGGSHYWAFEVTAGMYHLVIDAIANSRGLPVGLDASVLRPGQSEIRHVIDNVGVDQPTIRGHVTIAIEQDTTLVIRVGHKFQTTQYRLGLFEVDNMAIPTPLFTDCPDVVSMSLNSTQSFSLKRAEERWFSLNTEVGTYDVTVNTFRPDISVIQYRLDALTEFAQSSTELRLGGANTTEQTHTLESVLTVEKEGLTYFRFINPSVGFFYEAEMTVSKK